MKSNYSKKVAQTYFKPTSKNISYLISQPPLNVSLVDANDIQKLRVFFRYSNFYTKINFRY